MTKELQIKYRPSNNRAMEWSNLFRSLLFFLIIGLFDYSIITPRALADFDIGVYPPILQINATPPTSIDSPITVQNNGTDIANLSITFKGFKPSQDHNGQLQFLPDGVPMPGNDPFIFQKIAVLDDGTPIDSLVLAPAQTKKLVLHIELQKDEPSGDYYFSILFRSKDTLINQETTASVVGGIATNILLSIGPQDTTTGILETFSTPLFVMHGPINLSVLVNNTSHHFIVPTGDIVIQNIFGQNVARLGLLPVNILANSERFIPDTKSQSTTQAIWPEKLLVGLYSAHIRILLSDQGPLFERTIYFFAMPIEGIIILIILIVLGTTIGIEVRKRLQK